MGRRASDQRREASMSSITCTAGQRARPDGASALVAGAKVPGTASADPPPDLSGGPDPPPAGRIGGSCTAYQHSRIGADATRSKPTSWSAPLPRGGGGGDGGGGRQDGAGGSPDGGGLRGSGHPRRPRPLQPAFVPRRRPALQPLP